MIRGKCLTAAELESMALWNGSCGRLCSGCLLSSEDSERRFQSQSYRLNQNHHYCLAFGDIFPPGLSFGRRENHGGLVP